MNILITSATSELGQELAATLRGEHEIRLTDSITIDTNLEFTVSDLGHCESTNDLAREMDAIIHLVGQALGADAEIVVVNDGPADQMNCQVDVGETVHRIVNFSANFRHRSLEDIRAI